MILGRLSWLQAMPMEFHGFHEGLSNFGSGLRSNNTNRYFLFNQKNGIPSGYSSPYSWAPPIKTGGLAKMVKSNSDVNKALLAGAKSLSATLAGSGQLTEGILQMIVAFSAFLQNQGTISKADLRGVVEMAATVQSAGYVDTAILGAIANMSALVQGDGYVTYSELFGTLVLGAHIYVNEGSASVTQLVDGVWNARTADYVEPGTMGKALTDAGSAGNPWSSDVASNNDPGTFGELVQETKQKITPLPGMIFGA